MRTGKNSSPFEVHDALLLFILILYNMGTILLSIVVVVSCYLMTIAREAHSVRRRKRGNLSAQLQEGPYYAPLAY